MTTIEQAAIDVASRYAEVNGFNPADRRAVGLVLAGMALMAACPTRVESAFIVGYLDAFPDVRRQVEGWAEVLTAVVDQEST
jgi:hypothetical protein